MKRSLVLVLCALLTGCTVEPPPAVVTNIPEHNRQAAAEFYAREVPLRVKEGFSQGWAHAHTMEAMGRIYGVSTVHPNIIVRKP